MRRVVIIGCSGSGKSTLARRLGDITGLPVTHLDALFWQPGWVEPDKASFHDEVRRLARGDRWIIDGNYSLSLPERLDRADTVIFLDIPRRLSMWRISRRVVKYYGSTRPDLGEGCDEHFDPAFFWWVWRWRSRYRANYYRMIEERPSSSRFLVLRSPAAVEAYLRVVKPGLPEVV